MTAAREHAAGYYGRGWGTIPVKHRSKATSLPELAPYLTRRATKEELAAWSWSGVGIVTGPVSGVLVLDVDGPEGEAELRKHGHPPTPIVRTPGGGLHLYFRHPEQDVRTGIRVAPGLDVKASGGYVVAPPSVGANGGRYEWIVSPDDADLADPPAWLMGILERPRGKAAGPVGEQIPQGGRNQALASLAGSMRHRGAGEAEIFALLQVTNEQRCTPPLSGTEVRKIAASVARYEPGGEVVHVSFNGRGGQQQHARFNTTDMGNAERFVARHGEDVRYCYLWARWVVWTGARWERDEAGRVHKLAKETVRSIHGEAAAEVDDERRKALAKHARASEAESKIKAMLELAKSEVPASPDDFDANPLLLNAPNGTIDLRAGELRAHRREDLLTKMAGAEYDPKAAAPEWAAFLERVQPGEDLREFIQRGAGYSASGDTSEQCMFINHGASGANGKSTFQEALAAALGDYAMRTPTEMLLAKRGGGVPNDVARLKGSRFVAASETEEGRRLAESLVKDLTGQDTISARFMRAEWFDFKPTHKLWLSTNHKPEIRGTDNAIWRRIRLIPWTVAIPPAEQDRKLSAKLRGELPGVLAWAVRGCLSWQREGLRAPDEVRRATAEYRAEMDTLAAFLADRCVVGEGVRALADKLYQRYAMWCDDNGERKDAQKAFVARLSERGFERKRATKGADKGRYIWLGVGIREDYDDPDDDFGSPGEPRTRHGSPDESRADAPDSTLMNSIGESSEAENHINEEKTKPRKEMDKNGSLGSLGSPRGGRGEPLSAGLAPGQSATLEELRAKRGTGEALEEYLDDPPDWLRGQLARCAAEPGRWLKPTSSAIAQDFYGTATRSPEVAPVLERWLEKGGRPMNGKKRPAGELVPFPGVVSGHRDGWRWEPAMRLPSRWRRREIRYDDAQPSMWGRGAA